MALIKMCIRDSHAAVHLRAGVHAADAVQEIVAPLDGPLDQGAAVLLSLIHIWLMTFSFSTCSIATFRPSFFAQPPVSVMLSVAPAFFAMTKHLFATAISMPRCV